MTEIIPGELPRAMVAADAVWLAEVHGLSFPARDRWDATAFQELLTLPGVSGYVRARSALLLARSVLDECEILTIAVRPEARRQGLARRLLAQLIADRQAAAVARIFLEVDADNVAAIGLYRSLGFETIGTRADYYGKGRTALRMGLRVLAP